MSIDQFEKTLLAMLDRRPFKPFTVELQNGDRVEIDQPESTVLRQGLAVFMAPGPAPVYLRHDGVKQIIDSPGSVAAH